MVIVSTSPSLDDTATLNATDVDLHVHTLASACGYTPPQRVLDMARAAGRRVVAVTDHDSAAGAVAMRKLAAHRGDDVLVLVGMELTTSDLGHVILFGRGVEQNWGWQRNSPFPRHIPDHWLAIQAHPFRGKVTRRDGKLEVEPLPELPERIDAVEVWNGGDILKKTPQLRADFDALSWDYVRQYGKTPLASSDGHRPLWVHTFFTRFERPLTSVDDLVEQVRAGTCSPQASEQAHLDDCIARWGRREVVEWAGNGKDWRAMAVAAGYTVQDAEAHMERFQQVRQLVEGGASTSQIAERIGLTESDALDYISLVEEQVQHHQLHP